MRTQNRGGQVKGQTISHTHMQRDIERDQAHTPSTHLIEISSK